MWNLVCDVTMIVSSKSVFSTAYSHMHVLSPYREERVGFILQNCPWNVQTCACMCFLAPPPQCWWCHQGVRWSRIWMCWLGIIMICEYTVWMWGVVIVGLSLLESLLWWILSLCNFWDSSLVPFSFQTLISPLWVGGRPLSVGVAVAWSLGRCLAGHMMAWRWICAVKDREQKFVRMWVCG